MAKVVLELPDWTLSDLRQVAHDQKLELGELIQRAVVLYRYALERTADGRLKLSLTGPDDTVQSNIVVGNEQTRKYEPAQGIEHG